MGRLEDIEHTLLGNPASVARHHWNEVEWLIAEVRRLRRLDDATKACFCRHCRTVRANSFGVVAEQPDALMMKLPQDE